MRDYEYAGAGKIDEFRIIKSRHAYAGGSLILPEFIYQLRTMTMLEHRTKNVNASEQRFLPSISTVFLGAFLSQGVHKEDAYVVAGLT